MHFSVRGSVYCDHGAKLCGTLPVLSSGCKWEQPCPYLTHARHEKRVSHRHRKSGSRASDSRKEGCEVYEVYMQVDP